MIQCEAKDLGKNRSYTDAGQSLCTEGIEECSQELEKLTKLSQEASSGFPPANADANVIKPDEGMPAQRFAVSGPHLAQVNPEWPEGSSISMPFSIPFLRQSKKQRCNTHMQHFELNKT